MQRGQSCVASKWYLLSRQRREKVFDRLFGCLHSLHEFSLLFVKLLFFFEKSLMKLLILLLHALEGLLEVLFLLLGFF